MLEIRVEGLEEFRARMKKAPAELELEQRIAVSKAAAIAQDEAQRRINSPFGHAAKGIKIKIKGTGLDMEARIAAGNRAAFFSQRSTNPHKPPARVLAAWAARKGLPIADGDSRRAVGFRLANAIAIRGTTGKPIMRAAYDAVKGKLLNAFRDALVNTVEKLK